MPWIVRHLYLIPLLPLAAAAIIAVLKRPQRRLAAALAIGSLTISFGLAIMAFGQTLEPAGHGEVWRRFYNFKWLDLGATAVRLGWVLDPLAAIMLVMVTLVGALIFIYSVGYMAHDDNYTRFFGFLSLFAAAMLGLVIANSLLWLFVCWELVGLASYLLIGFWFQKPSAAAAAKKAFITTRVGDIGFFLGMLWLYGQTGTLLFFDDGQGCLEKSALIRLVTQTTLEGMAVSTVIGLLLFCGAAGKSGQVPLHVWLPDAMEGPTPVSALIHAATMVAAGVFLMARVYPLLEVNSLSIPGVSSALMAIAWVGAVTAVFAASIAVAQTDIKRILAYSTISQLGYMMLAIGVGGWVAGMFHLITHAFFKSLLFLGAGSVIHGCQEEQDIRHMGGLRRFMPVTFATYAVGMLALAGAPVLFAGFWSKDEILHTASIWPVSQGPFYLGLGGAFLTAFYMTRQVAYVFFGEYRGPNHGKTATGDDAIALSQAKGSLQGETTAKMKRQVGHKPSSQPHESPPIMTVPLAILAVGAVVLGFLGTPVWPWFHAYLTGEHAVIAWHHLADRGVLSVMGLSVMVFAAGVGLGWAQYGRKPIKKASERDALEKLQPQLFDVLRQKLKVDEFYEATVIRLTRELSQVCHVLDQRVCGGFVRVVTLLVIAWAWANRMIDEFLVNGGFDRGCGWMRQGAIRCSRVQNGQIHGYLRIIAVAMVLLVLFLAWGGKW